jgi:hypothetical protein
VFLAVEEPSNESLSLRLSAGRYFLFSLDSCTPIGWNFFPQKGPKSRQQLWQAGTFFHWMTPDNKLHFLKEFNTIMSNKVFKRSKVCIEKSADALAECKVCQNNWIHVSCSKKSWIAQGIDLEMAVVCRRRCMNKVIKSEPKSEDQSKKSFWRNDGPTSNVRSMSVLLDWLTTRGNYVK